MKTTEKQKLTKLLDKENYQEAVSYIEDLLVKSPSDEELLFNHSFIKNYYLDEISQSIIDELTKVIDMDGEYRGKALTLLCIVYSESAEFLSAYTTGTDPDVDYQFLQLDYYEAMGKACFELGYNHLEEGISYIDKIIDFEKNFDESIDPYWYTLQAKAYIQYKQFGNARIKLEKAYEIDGASLHYLILNASIKLEMYLKNHQAEDLEEAIKICEKAIKVDSVAYFLDNIYIRCLTYHREANKAIEVVEKYKDIMGTQNYVNCLVTIYCASGDYEKAEETVLLLKEEFSEKDIYEWIAEQIDSNADDENGLKHIKGYYMRAYELSKDINLLLCICNINEDLQLQDENLKLINEFMTTAVGNDALFAHLLKAETMRKLNYDYDEVVKEYETSNFKMYFPKFRYLLTLSEIVKDPSALYQSYKEFQQLVPTTAETYQYKSLGHFYLYGENEFPVNYKKAKNFIFAAYNHDKTSSCNVALLGRYYEVTKDEMNAFKCYKRAYELLENDAPTPICMCAYGFYAHACLMGVGSPKDEETSKTVVLKAIEKYGKRCQNTVLLQYAYFAVKGDSRFLLENAKEYLVQTSKFNRYNLTREVLIKQINDKLGIETVDYQTNLANCLKYSPACDVEYYHKHKNDQAFYICPSAL